MLQIKDLIKTATSPPFNNSVRYPPNNCAKCSPRRAWPTSRPGLPRPAQSKATNFSLSYLIICWNTFSIAILSIVKFSLLTISYATIIQQSVVLLLQFWPVSLQISFYQSCFERLGWWRPQYFLKRESRGKYTQTDCPFKTQNQE